MGRKRQNERDYEGERGTETPRVGGVGVVRAEGGGDRERGGTGPPGNQLSFDVTQIRQFWWNNIIGSHVVLRTPYGVILTTNTLGTP